MNIFHIMTVVSRRVEPYQAHFLAEALRVSQRGDRRLFEGFWRLAAPDSWNVPDETEISDEDVLVSGRIDLVLRTRERQVLGVEVKTSEASCTKGQLAGYLDGLRAKYPDEDYALAYVTPFNRARVSDTAVRIPSIEEFDRFRAEFDHCKHVSWLDLTEIEWQGGELWEQHKSYIHEVTCSPRLLSPSIAERTRGFADFFGEEAARGLSEAVAVTAETQGNDVNVASIRDPQAFAAAFRLLIESPLTARNRTMSNQFSVELVQKFSESEAGEVHTALFALADEYPHVWLQGKGNYGLRVAHPNHHSGVSIARSKGIDRVSMDMPR